MSVCAVSLLPDTATSSIGAVTGDGSGPRVTNQGGGGEGGREHNGGGNLYL